VEVALTGPVYVGNAATLAFLQFLRQILSRHMRPSHFTENKRGDVMLEVETPKEGVPDLEEEAGQNRTLIDDYFLAVSCSLSVVIQG
jgi:hypothetical protein